MSKFQIDHDTKKNIFLRRWNNLLQMRYVPTLEGNFVYVSKNEGNLNINIWISYLQHFHVWNRKSCTNLYSEPTKVLSDPVCAPKWGYTYNMCNFPHHFLPHSFHVRNSSLAIGKVCLALKFVCSKMCSKWGYVSNISRQSTERKIKNQLPPEKLIVNIYGIVSIYTECAHFLG